MDQPALRGRVLAGLNEQSPDVERAAIRVSLEHFLNDPQMAPLLKVAFSNLGSSRRNILIEEVNDPKFMRRHLGVAGGAVSQDQQYFLGKNVAYQKVPDFLDNPIVLDTVMASLGDGDANVRAAALDLLRKVKDVEQRTDFRTALDQLTERQQPASQTHCRERTGRKEAQ